MGKIISRIIVFVVVFIVGFLATGILTYNEMSGSFSDVHSVRFDVSGSPCFEPRLEVRVEYHMFYYETYEVRVTVDRDGTHIADKVVVIRSTSTEVQTEGASTYIHVPEAGSYTIVFSPEGSKKIDFRIHQLLSDNALFYYLAVGGVLATAVLVVWELFSRRRASKLTTSS